MKKNNSLKITLLLAMLAAISIICGKYLAIRGGDIMRFSLENMPIIFAGMAFGPLAGGAVGLVADLVGCLMVGYTVNPTVALGAAAIGAVSGLIPFALKKFELDRRLMTALTVAAAHLIGSVIIKTVGLAVYYDIPFTVLLLWRTLNYLIVGAIDGVAVYMLMKNKGIRMLIRRFGAEEKMTYAQAIEYIHGVSNFFCKPGLKRIRQLCAGLGNPQDKLKFIHVGGTNGKGSVCSMLESVLRAAGYRVGLFTSPYVHEFNERMRVNGENIPNGLLAEITVKVKAVADKMTDSPTEFELITAIALEYFKEEKCDVVVFEVGMGGRLDATNVIDAPLLSVITGIALDHTAFLGDTVEKIAYEKAGIIKSGAPILFGGENLGAEAVIAEEARKKQTTLYKTDYSKLKIVSSDLNGTVFDYKERENIKISLLGDYQPKNATTVLDAIDVLSSNGITISERAIYEGLSNARWPARFEIVSRNPLFIFDGAHNPEGVSAAVESVKRYFGNERVTVISGVLRDKDYNAIAGSISQIASEVYTITPNNPRALSAEEYANIYSEMGISALPCASVKEAIKLATAKAKNDKKAILCLGSLYTYCEIISLV